MSADRYMAHVCPVLYELHDRVVVFPTPFHVPTCVMARRLGLTQAVTWQGSRRSRRRGNPAIRSMSPYLDSFLLRGLLLSLIMIDEEQYRKYNKMYMCVSSGHGAGRRLQPIKPVSTNHPSISSRVSSLEPTSAPHIPTCAGVDADVDGYGHLHHKG